MTGFSYPRYLAAKKSVDDRALNRQVWAALQHELTRLETNGVEDGEGCCLKALEVGAGIGTMVERLFEWGSLKEAEYTAFDDSAENIGEACRRLPDWGDRNGYRVTHPEPLAYRLEKPGCRLTVRLETSDLFDFIERHSAQPGWDLLIANAFLDLVDLGTALPPLLGMLRPGGLFYFTINFDGLTAFQPPVDVELDEQIVELYRRTMDGRGSGKPHGSHSRTGRLLFGELERAGAQTLAAGASDWVVFPVNGGYPQDEAYFLHCIIDTIAGALTGNPALEAMRFQDWVARRHAQVERAELVYLAHQLDFTGRVQR